MKKRALQFIVWFVGDGTTKAFDVDLANDTLLLSNPQNNGQPLSACYLAGITKGTPIGIQIVGAIPVTAALVGMKATFTFATAPGLNGVPFVGFWLFF